MELRSAMPQKGWGCGGGGGHEKSYSHLIMYSQLTINLQLNVKTDQLPLNWKLISIKSKDNSKKKYLLKKC